MFPTLLATLLLFNWTTLYTASQETEPSAGNAAQGRATDASTSAQRADVQPRVGSWKYKEVSPEVGIEESASLTIKDDGGVWTVTIAWTSDLGPVTDVAVYDKGMILRKESFDHFLHKDQPWKPVKIELGYTGKKVTGVMKYVGSSDKPVAMDLGGPVFAVGNPDTLIGFLALADGYSTSFRYFQVDRVPIDPKAAEKLIQLKVVGAERVTVPAGTFDAFKVELTAVDGSYKETVWIDKDLRIPVKSQAVEVYRKGSLTTTSELVP